VSAVYIPYPDLGYLVLVAAWALVALRTAGGSLRGALFLPPTIDPAVGQ
jgi:hypothetical protein